MATIWDNLISRPRRSLRHPRESVDDGRAASAIDDNGDLHEAAERLGISLIDDLPDRHPSAVFVEHVPIAYARRHALLGLAGEGDEMPMAVAGLDNWDCLDVLSRLFDRPIEPMLAPREQILAAINAAYQRRTGQADAMIETLDEDSLPEGYDSGPGSDGLGLVSGGGASGGEDLLDVASRAPVIKLVNLVLFEAVKMLASDVHIQPAESNLVVRMRIDGVLFDAFELPRALHDEVVSRIKVIGQMNIAEKRLAQDGRASVCVGDRLIDLRISAVPTSFGESVVIRLLDKSARLYTLNELGMDDTTFRGFRELIGVEHGLMLVTGPTGSGKSTTLYAALQEIASRERNVITLEDPIEYQLPGVSQIQVSSKKGMTFASGLRSVLRQDPDIIMVGEIRDHETAVLAIQSALTGHLVFSTLHTNDAASAVTRLLDLGIEPYLVASSAVGVLAQRLVRQVCAECGGPIEGPAAELQRLHLESHEHDTRGMRRGKGCPACRHTGYRGRRGIFELLVVGETVRHHIQDRATATDIKRTAADAGMQTLREAGTMKVFEGVTTVDEVIRVTMRSTV